jgi:hypothetical protein
MSGSEKFLTVYSGLLTAAFAVVVLTGASAPRDAKFDEIDVQRINVREPDGTLRMTISNMAKFPGLIFKSKEYPHDRDVAGALFFNDEGTENGGLVFAGKTGPDGKVSHGVHLSMDQYQQDQVVVLSNIEEGGRRRSGLAITDRPTRSILEDVQEQDALERMPKAERDALLKKRSEEGYYGANRVFLGRNGERESSLDLKDASGKPRLRLKVEPDGQAAIEFLDARGKVQRTLTATDA